MSSMNRTLRSIYRWLLPSLLLSQVLWSAGPYQIRTEVKVNDAKEFVEPIRGLCDEWYAKINAALFGPGVPLPFQQVTIVFEPKIVSQNKDEIPAYADKNVIHVNSPYVVRTHKHMPDDYKGMLAHELTHVVQNYPDGAGPGWLVEGIADYVRHKYYEKDIESRLHLDANGQLTGFELDRNKGQFEKNGYLAGYTVAGAFLYWLEISKDKTIVTVLNRALRDRKYTPAFFEQHCGAPLDALWQAFVEQSKQKP